MLYEETHNAIDGSSRLLPPNGYWLSAIGFLRAPVAYEVTRSLYQRLSGIEPVAVNDLLQSMRGEAYAVVEAGAQGRALNETRQAQAMPPPPEPVEAVMRQGSYDPAAVKYWLMFASEPSRPPPTPVPNTAQILVEERDLHVYDGLMGDA